ncbi:hypothetical protein SCLCIDRAFT_1217389 [Scleroderma citrinum Foug A]|uniref:Uncharacterized protein n=1 Tax=Scleroderma citrinum Foug A TaxID=1036808 RepID=A0A0C3DUV2_9AGAM|nr:hypothetical protein SCLCIDRAFT_1217389 [Scleroderma citrinum Foug A]
MATATPTPVAAAVVVVPAVLVLSVAMTVLVNVVPMALHACRTPIIAHIEVQAPPSISFEQDNIVSFSH